MPVRVGREEDHGGGVDDGAELPLGGVERLLRRAQRGDVEADAERARLRGCG